MLSGILAALNIEISKPEPIHSATDCCAVMLHVMLRAQISNVPSSHLCLAIVLCLPIQAASVHDMQKCSRLLWLLQPGQALIEKGLQGLDVQIGLRPPRAQAGSEPETDLDKVYQLLEASAWLGKVVARNKQKEEIAEFLEMAVTGKHVGEMQMALNTVCW